MLIRPRKRRREVAELLTALLERHRTGTFMWGLLQRLWAEHKPYVRTGQARPLTHLFAGRITHCVPQSLRKTLYVTWDNASTHQDNEIEAVVRGAAGRLVLLYLPTYSPWLNPIEMLWRHFRREVTHCELFPTVTALLAAAAAFFDRYNRSPQHIRSIIGSHPAEIP